MKSLVSILFGALLLAAVAATGTGETASSDSTAAAADTTSRDLGVGPVKHVELGPLDAKLAAHGKDLFGNKCTICHEMDKKKIGPALGDVLDQRTPEFVMNMILNARQMEQHDPEAKRLLEKYKVAMQDMDLNREDARAILEYLRQEQAGRDKGRKPDAAGK